MNLWKSIAGMVEVELTCASMEQALDAIRQENISVFKVVPVSDLTVGFRIYRKDYSSLQKMAKRKGYNLKITEHRGIYWKGKAFLYRPVLWIGIALLIFSAISIPRCVLFVQVEGNEHIPDKLILEAAENCGIRFGAAREQIRSEKVKNQLLSAIPELQWAGVNTKGCVAVISVRERIITERMSPETTVSNIVADRDGIILNCTASSGTLVCGEGQAVVEGELLISGYTDCGLIIQATRAEGEVYAQTMRNLMVVSPRKWVSVRDDHIEIGAISLLVGKKRINLWKDSGIWDSTCGRMYKEYFLTLPGGFRLPLALCVDIGIQRQESLSEYNQGSNLEEYARSYLCSQMVAGTILRESVSVSEQTDCLVLQASYICSEMIGRVQSELIGEQHGKTN